MVFGVPTVQRERGENVQQRNCVQRKLGGQSLGQRKFRLRLRLDVLVTLFERPGNETFEDTGVDADISTGDAGAGRVPELVRHGLDVHRGQIAKGRS